jgi:hypothetical protein
MISFCAPCLKWKFIMAFKGHNGYNGFLPPYRNKYLKHVVKLTLDQSGLTYPGGIPVYPKGGGVTIQQDEFDIDPLTGFLTNIPNGSTGGQHFFPYFGATLPAPQPPGDGVTNVTASDTSYTITHYFSEPPLNGLAKNITEVTLSNQYTLAQLDADTDALINVIDPNTIPWGGGLATWHVNNALGGPDLGTIYAGVDQQLLPASTQIPFPPRGPAPPTSFTVPQLGAAAAYTYAPSPFGEPVIAPYDKPGAYMKLVGFIQMAGNYCKKNFYIDWEQKPISQSCQSGQGWCGAAFRVNPPPIIVGQDAYTMIVPDCQCIGAS